VKASTFAIAAAQTRILARRRTALLLLALLPLAFYGALYRHSPHAIAIAGVASAFSVGGAGIFSMLPALTADQRLVLVGYRPTVLVLGRLVVLELAGAPVAAITWAVMMAGSSPSHPAEVFAGLILTVAVAVPLGLALGALLPRELEAMLVLIGLVGIQMTAAPDTLIAKLLPFHAAAQLLDASVGPQVAFWPRLAISVCYGVALLAVAWVAWLRRAALWGPLRSWRSRVA
jgi:hypothetical protein